MNGCGHAVTLAIPALDVTGLAGTTRSVGTQPIPSATDGRYRQTIDLVDASKHHIIGSEAWCSRGDKVLWLDLGAIRWAGTSVLLRSTHGFGSR